MFSKFIKTYMDFTNGLMKYMIVAYLFILISGSKASAWFFGICGAIVLLAVLGDWLKKREKNERFNESGNV